MSILQSVLKRIVNYEHVIILVVKNAHYIVVAMQIIMRWLMLSALLSLVK